MTLRSYQSLALDEIKKCFAQGIKKVLLQMPTGSGKTLCFCEMLKGVKEKNKKAIMVVHGRKLIDQASKRLDREGVDHGVVMANHWRRRPHENIQICSIDTLVVRKVIPDADMVIIDECHQATSNGYTWLMQQYDDKFILGVTATPYCQKSLRHIADVIINPISLQKLIDQNYLVPPVYFSPSIPDLTGVRTIKGDYDVEELDKVLNQNLLIGDIVSNWVKLGENRPTLTFGISVNHSKAIAEAFNKVGIPAVHIDAEHTDKERQDAIDQLERGEIKIISNVGVFCTGVDIPAVSCLIPARPTKSYSLYIQQLGRGTRLFPGKKDFLVIDHSGNVLRHGLIEVEREGSLDPILTEKKPRDAGLTTCEVCYAIYARNEKCCPRCGTANPMYEREEKHLSPLKADFNPADMEHLRIVARRGALKDIAKRKGYKRGWIYFKLKEEFGEIIAEQYMPKRDVPDWVKKNCEKYPQKIGKN